MAYRAGATGASGRPVTSTGAVPTTSARLAWRSRKSPSAAGFQLSTMRCASRVSPSRVSSVASCSPAANCSGHARTTVETAPSFSAERATSAARSFTAPARREMEPALRSRAVRASPVTAWTRTESGAAATHSAADTSSEQMIRAAGAARAAEVAAPDSESGGGGARSSQSSPACSGAGGVTSTTCRPRATAAFTSSSVTRSSIIKGRGYGKDASFR